MSNGGSIDNDGRPGNSGESESYSRIYDPFGIGETSNTLETQNRIQAERLGNLLAQRRKAARDALRAAQDDVHFFPGVGKFIIPEDTTWAAHAKIVHDNNSQLFFNPDRYVYFDKIIADRLKLPALYDKEHKDYKKYEGLRTNLEVLRNDIIGQYLDDGEFDKGDEIYVGKITAVATAIGELLANGRSWKRPFTKHIDMDVANVEAIGAAEIYKLLLEEQDKTQFGRVLRDGFRDFAGLNDKNWGLLPLHKTPFSPEALAEPLPPVEQMIPLATAQANAEDAALKAREAALKERELDLAHSLGSTDDLARIERSKRAEKVESLPYPTKVTSTEEGRTILRWLRNLQATDRDTEEWLGMGTAPEQHAKADSLSQLVDCYYDQMAIAYRQHPERMDSDAIAEGRDAAGAITLALAEHCLKQLPPESDAYNQLEAAIDSMPDQYFAQSHQSLARLIGHIENGLSDMTKTPQHTRSTEERMYEAATRLNQHARQLQSVDTLETPKREESVELGREILRKLKKMLSSDKPFDEGIDSGRPEDKVRIAERFEELAELYKNLLATVAISNPAILRSKKIEEANDAVGSFSHAVSLLAAKEMPGSAAAAQQISADAAAMPNKWKGMDSRTMERLIKHVEAAIEQLGQEQHAKDSQRQKEEEQSQEMMQANANMMHGTSRRRRKRHASGIGGKKALKVQQELAADDMAAGQGRFRDDRKEAAQSAYMGLSAMDIAAIRDLGNSLRSAGDQGMSMAAAQNVTVEQTITPDGQSTAERTIEQITKQKRSGNRSTNSNRPRK